MTTKGNRPIVITATVAGAYTIHQRAAYHNKPDFINQVFALKNLVPDGFFPVNLTI